MKRNHVFQGNFREKMGKNMELIAVKKAKIVKLHEEGYSEKKNL